MCPLAIIILSALAFIAIVPPIAEHVGQNRLGLAFGYRPYPPGPVIDEIYYFAIDIPLLLLSIISGVGLLKRQRWAWFSTMVLFALSFSVHIAASTSIGPDATGQGFIGTFDSSYGRLATIAISLAGFYVLSRKDVRNYLNSNEAIT